jgi:hypothetical protein
VSPERAAPDATPAMAYDAAPPSGATPDLVFLACLRLQNLRPSTPVFLHSKLAVPA